MQEKLAEMRSRFMTQVSIRVKPVVRSETANTIETDEEMQDEAFKVLNTTEMGLAK